MTSYIPFKFLLLKYNDELTDYKIKKIIVFSGSKKYKYSDKEINVGIDDEELYHFAPAYIHNDDTIEIIKQKLCAEDDSITIPEIYLEKVENEQ